MVRFVFGVCVRLCQSLFAKTPLCISLRSVSPHGYHRRCFVGKRRLEQAISTFRGQPKGRDAKFAVSWKPYQLNPAAPQDDPGKNKSEVYAAKFGKERVEQMIPRMTETFKEIGEVRDAFPEPFSTKYVVS